MNTYSHALVAAALEWPAAKRIAQKPGRVPPIRMSALIVGSAIPDFLLTALAIIFIARDWFVGAFAVIDFESREPGQPTPQEWIDASLTVKLFDVWFFENPWVIALQNVFHSPLLLALFLVMTYLLWKRGVKWMGWLFWMNAAAMLHTLIDIPLHVDDGPLLLFPLNWTWRYEAPISYWDPDYYGREWGIFEHLLDLALIGFLIWRYWEPIRNWFGKLFRRSSAEA